VILAQQKVKFFDLNSNYNFFKQRYWLILSQIRKWRLK
jgi:hypothetical protein